MWRVGRVRGEWGSGECGESVRAGECGECEVGRVWGVLRVWRVVGAGECGDGGGGRACVGLPGSVGDVGGWECGKKKKFERKK